MVERIKIGLLYEYNVNWIGGTYYVENIIHALNLIDDLYKPEIFIFTTEDKSYVRLKENINYPYLYRGYYPKYNLFERIVNKLWRLFHSTNLIQKNISDFKFLGFNPAECFHKNQIYWIPDFQDLYQLDFFSESERKGRINFHLNLTSQEKHVVFSSEDSKKDFLKFYPEAKSKTYVLSFAVTHPEYESLDFETLKQKYQLPEKYFLCPNQFWIHKNHLLLLKAIKILKDKGVNIYVAFTGKEYEYRNPNHFDSLLMFVEENGLKDNVNFLGFIERRHQLKIMSKAICVIQPSLFEGWSTVIEDAKAMNQFVLASNLAVHKEQLKFNALFFDPNNELELSNVISGFLESKNDITILDYKQNIRDFGNNFLNIVKSISTSPSNLRK